MPRPNKKNLPAGQSSEASAKAEDLLGAIRDLSVKAAAMSERLQAEVEAIRARYQIIGELNYQIEVLDKELRGLMRERQVELFAGRDKVALTPGFLFRGLETRVTIPRNVLSLLKTHGWTEAIQVTESLKRKVVEKWPLDRLTLIGARRLTVDKFSYEIHYGRAQGQERRFISKRTGRKK